MARPSQTYTTIMRTLWRDCPSGYVDLRAIGKAGTVQRFVTTVGEIDAFCELYGKRGSEYGVYFGVCKREAKSGKKDAVTRATALWADIDTVKDGLDTDTVARSVHNLPDPLKPSIMVASGGGLHVYWLLDAPYDVSTYEARSRFEAANMMMGQLVSGDSVHDVTRVLRVPGTYNNKRKPPRKCEVLYINEFRVNTLDTLVTAASNGKVRIGDKFKSPSKPHREVHPLDAYREAVAGGRRSLARDLDALWRDRVRYSAPRGYIGIHEAQVMTTARLHCLGVPAETIVEMTLSRTQERMDRDAPDVAWDWEAEKRTIEGMLSSWAPKWSQLRKAGGSNGRAAKV